MLEGKVHQEKSLLNVQTPCLFANAGNWCSHVFKIQGYGVCTEKPAQT